ncbi:MAG: hypothetical protein COB59_11150 [Rhodospirillaceae bacterium]|nr:MAG: hypothetical protein COB59_11150 [Rhodospirillaceae bacterium]
MIVTFLFCLQVAYAGERAGPSSAHINGVEKSRYYQGFPAEVDQSHFFDFDFAKKAFENYETFQDLDNGFEAEYAAWDKKFKNKPRAEALAVLENHPDKIKIMQAHDFQWAYYAWTKMLFRSYGTSKTDAFPGVRQWVNWSGWNNWDDYFCAGIKKRNIFNDSCIVPDWRTTDQKIFALNQRNSINITREKEIDLLESLLKDKTLGNKNRKVIQGSLDRLRAAK